MKHIALCIWLVATCVIALPAQGLAAYLIELKNGSQYVTHDYWEEGNQIKFNFSGGQIGFSKDSVLKITDTDLPVKEEIVTPETPSTEAEPTPDANAPTVSEKPGKNTLDPEAVKEYMGRKESLVKWLQKTQAVLKLEQEQGKGDAWIENRKKKIEGIKGQLDELAMEVTERNSGVLPSWWHETTIPEK